MSEELQLLHRMRLTQTALLLASCGSSIAASIAHAQAQAPIPAASILQEHEQQLHDIDVTSEIDPSILDDVINASPLLTFHRRLVEIESISYNEGNVGDLVMETLKANGFTVEKQLVESNNEAESNDISTASSTKTTKERFNIFAYPSNNPHPQILLTSHIDTVPPFIPYHLAYPQTVSEFFNRSNVLIAGRGTVDAKACVAAQTFTAVKMLKAHPELPLALLFVVGEEDGGDGMRTFSDSALFQDKHKSNLTHIIFGEPTQSTLVSGHKGIYPFTLHATGIASHSGYPWLGRSATSIILPLLTKLDWLASNPEAPGSFPSSKKFGATTLNIGHVTAGVAPNVLPASATARCLTRLAAGDPDVARSVVQQAILDVVPEEDRQYITFTDGTGYPPVDIDADVDGFDVMTVNYGTDVPQLKLAPGAKRYLYGPGSILVAHGANEGLKVGDLEAAVGGYEKLVWAGIERLGLVV